MINWIEATEENISQYLSDCIEDHVQFKKINFAKCDYGFVTAGGDIVNKNDMQVNFVMINDKLFIVNNSFCHSKIMHFALRSEFDAILPKKGE